MSYALSVPSGTYADGPSGLTLTTTPQTVNDGIAAGIISRAKAASQPIVAAYNDAATGSGSTGSPTNQSGGSQSGGGGTSLTEGNAWSPSSNYVAGQVATYSNGRYEALKTVAANTPPSVVGGSDANWLFLGAITDGGGNIPLAALGNSPSTELATAFTGNAGSNFTTTSGSPVDVPGESAQVTGASARPVWATGRLTAAHTAANAAFVLFITEVSNGTDTPLQFVEHCCTAGAANVAEGFRFGPFRIGPTARTRTFKIQVQLTTAGTLTIFENGAQAYGPMLLLEAK